MKISSFVKTANELASLIEKSRLYLASVSNTGMITLYWQLGNALSSNEYDKPVSIREITNALNQVYKASFTVLELKAMQNFFLQYPAIEQAAALSSILSWQHLRQLTEIKSREQQLYYINLTGVKKLTPSGLKAEIQKDKFHTQKKTNTSIPYQRLKLKRSEKIVNRHHFPETNGKVILAATLRDYFTGSVHMRLKQLASPVIRNNSSLARRMKDQNLLYLLIELIQERIKQIYAQLNTDMNKIIWEIGNMLIAESKIAKQPVISNLLIRELKEKYNISFTKRTLGDMIAFAKNYPRWSDALQLSYCLSWPYIAHLLQVDSRQARLSYASRIVAQEIGKTALKELIAKGSDSGDPGIKKEIKPKYTRKLIEKSGNKTTLITHYILPDMDIQLKVIDIFKNPFFRLIST